MSSPVAYRFRTASLHGPWRSCPRQAEQDAVRAHQAHGEAGNLCWRVPGIIEHRKDTDDIDRPS